MNIVYKENTTKKIVYKWLDFRKGEDIIDDARKIQLLCCILTKIFMKTSRINV